MSVIFSVFLSYAIGGSAPQLDRCYECVRSAAEACAIPKHSRHAYRVAQIAPAVIRIKRITLFAFVTDCNAMTNDMCAHARTQSTRPFFHIQKSPSADFHRAVLLSPSPIGQSELRLLLCICGRDIVSGMRKKLARRSHFRLSRLPPISLK